MYISISIHTLLVPKMKERIKWEMLTNMEWEIVSMSNITVT